MLMHHKGKSKRPRTQKKTISWKPRIEDHMNVAKLLGFEVLVPSWNGRSKLRSLDLNAKRAVANSSGIRL